MISAFASGVSSATLSTSTSPSATVCGEDVDLGAPHQQVAGHDRQRRPRRAGIGPVVGEGPRSDQADQDDRAERDDRGGHASPAEQRRAGGERPQQGDERGEGDQRNGWVAALQPKERTTVETGRAGGGPARRRPWRLERSGRRTGRECHRRVPGDVSAGERRGSGARPRAPRRRPSPRQDARCRRRRSPADVAGEQRRDEVADVGRGGGEHPAGGRNRPPISAAAAPAPRATSRIPTERASTSTERSVPAGPIQARAIRSGATSSPTPRATRPMAMAVAAVRRLIVAI